MEILFRFSSKLNETGTTMKEIRERENYSENITGSFSDVLYVYDDNNNLML